MARKPTGGAVHEAVDLIHVYEAFGKTNVVPKALLKKIVAGKESELQEERNRPISSQPRNFLFELCVAAMFAKKGFSVRVGEEADVTFNFKNHRAFVECKRVFSESGLERSITKAAKQLSCRFKSFGSPVNPLGQVPLGIAAFSIEKIVNPAQSYLKAPSRHAMVEHLD